MEERIERPHEHYRVLEPPGSAPLLTGRVLADLGADVIKVEPPNGDAARLAPPVIDGPSGDASGQTRSLRTDAS